MAFEPKPPQGNKIPVWIGGAVPRTLERVAEYGDGWMGQFVKGAEVAARLMARIREQAEAHGRDRRHDYDHSRGGTRMHTYSIRNLSSSLGLIFALAGCGAFALNSRELDPVVRGFIGNDTFPSGEDVQHGDFF